MLPFIQIDAHLLTSQVVKLTKLLFFEAGNIIFSLHLFVMLSEPYKIYIQYINILGI